MLELRTIELPKFPYIINEIGVLLFSHYPTTIVFADAAGEPVIKEWVDCSDDNHTDRHFYFRTTKLVLKKFIAGEISHLDLINSSLDKILIFEDSEGENVIKLAILPLKDLPVDYKPKPSFLFNQRDGVDTEKVKEHFKLDEIESKKSNIELVKEISGLNNSETLYIHLNQGKGVGHGYVNTTVFGKTILNFDKLYKNIALDTILGNDRGEVFLDAEKNKEYLQYTETALYDNRIAASYGFLLRPYSQQTVIFGETQTEIIAVKTLGLISKSKEQSSLREEYLSHSGFTINSYKQFLDGVIKTRLNLEVNWFNPLNNRLISDTLEYRQANRILSDIDNLSIAQISEIKPKGKFRAVNCDTGHFHFISLYDEQYTGYFDKIVKESIVAINFIDIYQVTISRKIIKEASQRDEKIVDTIISYYLDTGE